MSEQSIHLVREKAEAFDWLEKRREYPVTNGVDYTHILPYRWNKHRTLLEAIQEAMKAEQE